jgi:hypothetical protein
LLNVKRWNGGDNICFTGGVGFCLAVPNLGGYGEWIGVQVIAEKGAVQLQ